MNRVWAFGALFLALVVIVFASDGRAAPAKTKRGALPGLALKSHAASVGAPIQAGRLTAFPIYADSNPAFAGAKSLEAALEARTAAVREVTAPVEGKHRQQRDAATVGKLMLENRGKQPIFVLAGTVVKGGKQDRQIAQDFVVAAGDTVAVDAFCVEQGRWNSTRGGKDTGGGFRGTNMLAPTKVRVAAQHSANQSKVWDEVAKTNRRAKKTAKSGTLMATVDAKDVTKRRERVADKIRAGLRGAADPRRIVGLAFAIDSKVHSVRWFASRSLFEQHRDKLIGSAALEVVTSTPAEGKKPRLRAKHVKAFIEGAAAAPVRSRKKTAGANENVYREAKDAYSAETVMPDSPAPVSVDFVAK